MNWVNQSDICGPYFQVVTHLLNCAVWIYHTFWQVNERALMLKWIKHKSTYFKLAYGITPYLQWPCICPSNFAKGTWWEWHCQRKKMAFIIKKSRSDMRCKSLQHQLLRLSANHLNLLTDRIEFKTSALFSFTQELYMFRWEFCGASKPHFNLSNGLKLFCKKWH